MPIGLKGNSDGSGAIQIGGSDAISISTGLNTTFAGTITASGGVMYPLTSGTAIASTSGTAIDFTGIPSWVKRITVMLSGVSTNGTSPLTLRLGTSGGIVSSGYTGSAFYTPTVGSFSTDSTGYPLTTTSLTTAASSYRGSIIVSLLGSNIWIAQGTLYSTAGGGTSVWISSEVTLGGTLDRVRVTMLNGTDAFDAGTINILYE